MCIGWYDLTLHTLNQIFQNPSCEENHKGVLIEWGTSWVQLNSHAFLLPYLSLFE